MATMPSPLLRRLRMVASAQAALIVACSDPEAGAPTAEATGGAVGGEPGGAHAGAPVAGQGGEPGSIMTPGGSGGQGGAAGLGGQSAGGAGGQGGSAGVSAPGGSAGASGQGGSAGVGGEGGEAGSGLAGIGGQSGAAGDGQAGGGAAGHGGPDCNDPSTWPQHDQCIQPFMLGTCIGPPEDGGEWGEQPDGSMRCPPAENAPLWQFGCLPYCSYVSQQEAPQDGQCCYRVYSSSCCGRPIVVEARQRVAGLRAVAGWG